MVNYSNLWVLVTPAEDVPEQWVGHCLDLDVVSQGSCPEGALKATKEAVLMVLRDDLEKGLDSTKERQRAPREYWDRLSKVLRDGGTLEVVEDRLALRSKIQAMATQFRFVNGEKGLADISPMWRLVLA